MRASEVHVSLQVCIFVTVPAAFPHLFPLISGVGGGKEWAFTILCNTFPFLQLFVTDILSVPLTWRNSSSPLWEHFCNQTSIFPSLVAKLSVCSASKLGIIVPLWNPSIPQCSYTGGRGLFVHGGKLLPRPTGLVSFHSCPCPQQCISEMVLGTVSEPSIIRTTCPFAIQTCCLSPWKLSQCNNCFSSFSLVYVVSS